MAETDDAAVLAHLWIERYNSGGERYLDLCADDLVWVEAPTPMFPAGRRGDLAAMRAAHAASHAALTDRRADLHEVIADGNAAALRYTWSATVAGEGTGQPVGTRVHGEVAAFVLVRHGRIAELREIAAFADPS